MEIFNNDYEKNGQSEDVMTAMEILATARPAERKAFIESLPPGDKIAEQFKVVDEVYQQKLEAHKQEEAAKQEKS